MLEHILQRNNTLHEKIEELKKMVTDPSFLEILVNPGTFLEEIIPFAAQTFRDLPPDSEMTFGSSNDMRVFFMRLLSKFKYKDYSNPSILEVVYDLIQTENIFNRYLSFKILFPLLDSNIPVNYQRHLKCLGSFLKNELPTTEGLDNSRCELGFFTVSEVLNYLKHFQKKYNLGIEYYEEILCMLASFLRIYFTQKLVEKLCNTKKIICEFCSMGINLIKLLAIVNISPNHFLCSYISDLCYTLVNIAPIDCYSLRKDIFENILKLFKIRKDLVPNLDRYFYKNLYLNGNSAVQIADLKFLSELVKDFSGKDTNWSISRGICFEFDQRIVECIPVLKNEELLCVCLESLCINYANCIKIINEMVEMRMHIYKHIKIANNIYKLYYSSKNKTNLHVFLMNYLKLIIKSLSSQQKLFENEQILILSNFLIFPLTLEVPCSDYISLFNEIPLENLEQIVLAVVDTLFIRYYNQVYSWNVLTAVPEINCILIKTANKLIYYDFMNNQFRSPEFYQKVFFLAYGFFKIDKKYIKSEYSEYFTVIYEYLLQSLISNSLNNSLTGNNLNNSNSHIIINNHININTSNSHISNISSSLGNIAANLLNNMFLDVKACDIAYTGLYFIYNYFESTVKELYNSYTLTFDSFYLEVLFNIPVSLNLLVTKYAVLLNAMSAGLKANKKIRDIIIKYIEYIVEFDNDEALMDELLIEVYKILQNSMNVHDSSYSKGINVLSRISNKHRNKLTNSNYITFDNFNDESLCNNNFENLCNTDKYVYNNSNTNSNDYIEDTDYDLNQIEKVLKNDSILKFNQIYPSSNNNTIQLYLLKKLGIPLLIGYEFVYLENIRKDSFISRTLKVYDLDLKTVGISFIDNLKKELYNLSSTISDKNLISDIYLSFLILNESDSISYVANCKDSSIFYNFIPDGLIYAPSSTFMLFEKILNSRIINYTIESLVDFIYSDNDLKSNRAIAVILKVLKMGVIDSKTNTIVLNSLYFKLKRCNSYNMYLILYDTIRHIIISSNNYSNNYNSCSNSCNNLHNNFSSCNNNLSNNNITNTIINNSNIAVNQTIAGGILNLVTNIANINNQYAKAMAIELSSLFNTPCPFDQLFEVDKKCILRILKLNPSFLAKFNNLPFFIETFLKIIDKKDTNSIETYLNFLFKMKNFPFFNDLLAPAKKYLPSIAVLEGFTNENARKKFVENVNRNGNFQTQNPNSFVIFRNLFHKCNVSTSIKSNFIEVYASQTKEHKCIILEIILNSLEYDISSFDFLISKLAELPILKNDSLIGLSKEGIEIFNILSNRILEQPANLRDMIIMYLIEHIHIDFVYNFIDLCIPINNEIMLILTNFLNDFLNNNHSYREQLVFSKAAYNILRYLRRRRCRFNDNKAVLLVYRDLYNIENDIEGLVNWYFKNFTVEDIELLYRINNGFVIRSESIVYKMVGIENGSIKSRMISSIYKQCNNSYLDSLDSGSNNNGSNSNGSNNNGSNINNANINNINNTNLNNNNINNNNININSNIINNYAFLKRCLNYYLNLKGIPLNENLLQNTYRILEKQVEKGIEKNINVPESEFIFKNEVLESSESDISLFLDSLNDVIYINDNSSNNNLNNGSNNNINNINNIGINTNNSHITNNSNSNININNTTNSNIIITNNVGSYDLSFLVNTCLDILPLIFDFFCDLKIYSKIILEKSKEIISSNLPYRYSALYYLCLFEPSVEYFESTFKLNYQERKYVFQSLQLLIKKFGINTFFNSIKTVLRSEMRFRTTEYILVPFLYNNPAFLENQEILFELCVFMHRLIRFGKVDLSLIKLILSFDQISTNFKKELNTLCIIKNSSYISNYSIDYKLLENSLPDSSSLFNYLEDKNELLFDRNVLVNIFNNNLEIVLSKNVILLLNLPISVYFKSNLDNQMSILELYVSNSFNNNGCTNGLKDFNMIDAGNSNINENSNKDINNIINNSNNNNIDIITNTNSNIDTDKDVIILNDLFVLLENLIKEKYPNTFRFNSIFPSLIKLFPNKIPSLISPFIVDNEFVYPPLLDNLPFIFEICEPDLAISLSLKRPSNISIDTLELNSLHLFKTFPYSLDSLKKQFFNGLLSSNRNTRLCYLDILLSQIPSEMFDIILFILQFNDLNLLEDFQVEYFIAVLLCSNLQIVDFLYLSKYNSILIEKLLTNLFSSPSCNIKYLFEVFNNCFVASFKIKQIFIKAFLNVGISCVSNGLYYDPYRPNLKYYQLVDREMYLGLVKSTCGLREIRIIVDSIIKNKGNEDIYQMCINLAKRIETKQVSYKMDDVYFIEGEMRRVILENQSEYMCTSSFNNLNNISCCNNYTTTNNTNTSKSNNSFVSQLDTLTEFDLIESKFLKILENIQSDKNVFEEVKNLITFFSIIFYIPRNSLIFSKLLMFCSIASEIIESLIIIKDNLTESIYGRFRMWMIRHPSFYSSLFDWNVFMKWRTFIFSRALNIVSENDKRKVSSELCKLNCIYASKNFKEKLYAKSCSILNDGTSITMVEIAQNMQRILLDLESLYNLKDYSTMISLINSLNIAKFSNEEKGRLYYWGYKAFKRMGKVIDAEKYGLLSRKLFEILENKKEDLEILKERMLNEKKGEIIEKDNLYKNGFSTLLSNSANLNNNLSTGNNLSNGNNLNSGNNLNNGNNSGTNNVSNVNTNSPNTNNTSNINPNTNTNNTANIGDNLEQNYILKLIEIINELNVEDSRIYILELLKFKNLEINLLNGISHQKLYYFIPQLKKSINIDFMLNKNLLLKNCEESNSVFDCYEVSKRNRDDILKEILENETLKSSNSLDYKNLDNNTNINLDYNTNTSNTNINSNTINYNLQFVDKIFKMKDIKINHFYKFDPNIPLIAEFSNLRNKYDDIKLMEYIENITGNNIVGHTFYVRVSDGSLCKIIQNFNTSPLNPTFMQFIQIFNNCIKPFELEKLGFDLSLIPTVNSKIDNISYSVHSSIYFSAEDLLINYLYKNNIPINNFYSSINGNTFRNMVNLMEKWKNTFKLEILTKFSNYNDYYVFKRNFINSYSSFICFSTLLNITHSSYQNFYFNSSGNSFITVYANNKNNKFYFKPGLQVLFGNEGINGPLFMFLNEFLNKAQNDKNIYEIACVLGIEKQLENSSINSKIKGEKEEFNISLLIEEMIDPKNANNLSFFDIPWL